MIDEPNTLYNDWASQPAISANMKPQDSEYCLDSSL